MRKVRKKSFSQMTVLPTGSLEGSWRWVVDNRMRDFGETDFQRCIVRINRDLHRKRGELLIDTLFHEELHCMFPYLSERAVCNMTKALLPTLSPRYRARLYARLRRSSRCDQ
jgi:hypothetical protein